MSGSALLIGTIIYAVLGVVGCVGFSIYVGQRTKNPHEIPENRRYQYKYNFESIALVSVTIATFCLWLMWIVAYMA
jgi:V-type H+-transporting ATPase subunit e